MRLQISSTGCHLILLAFVSAIQQGLAIPEVSIADLINFSNSNNNQEQQFSRTSRSSYGGERCGYESCPASDDKKLNVHVVAHTHDDVGWLKTVDQYYYGTMKRKFPVGVQHILNTLMPQLVMDPKKRFVYVEMSFFSKWWAEQEEPMRGIVRRLVNEGRLEFINGGWCMNDEATVNYQSTIEQMTLGLKFLNDTFGACGLPRVGWQIDPFGHTSEQASLFAQFGFDSMFFTRISYEDKLARRQNKSLDIVWHADRALAGQAGSIYTNVMYDTYSMPDGYCFDATCLDDEIVDNKKSYEYNIERKAKKLIEDIRKRATSKLTNDILLPFGGDFQFSAAEHNFLNMDKLIKYINRIAPDLNMFYSTPSCYAYAVYQHTRAKKPQRPTTIELPEKYDDFMPYDSTPTTWWSGYFTSRPSVKLIERQTGGLLQVARMASFESLVALAKRPDALSGWSREFKSHEEQCLGPLWEILGDLQHHDAVTGTEQQHVADDYVRRAQDASDPCIRFIGASKRQRLENKVRQTALYKKLVTAIKGSKYISLEPIFMEATYACRSLNISQCEPLEANVDQSRYLYKLAQPIKSEEVAAATPQATAAKTGQSSEPGDQRSAVLVHSDNKSKKEEYPSELETRAVLMYAHNPHSHPIKQHDFRLPCIGMCDLSKIRVTQLANNASLQLIRLPVPAGITSLPFRDAFTTFEVLFYADLPAFGYTSFLIEDVNFDELIDDELALYSLTFDQSSSESAESVRKEITKPNTAKRQKRIKRMSIDDDDDDRYEYFRLGDDTSQVERAKREVASPSSEQSEAEKLVVKFDLQAGMIIGLKRVSDGSFLNVTQKFGYYYPANFGPPPGAYIFRPNTTEPKLMDKPLFYKLYKRRNGALVEIHQKWADWIWQTIRVDSRKNYIEFDYFVGPIPLASSDMSISGREIITRYITDVKTDKVFLTDSNARQLLVRKSNVSSDMYAEDLGGNFYPVVSTIMLKNTKDQVGCTKCEAEAVSVLVDRPQAGSSLHDGQIELLLHRRFLIDDRFGVSEPLNEPGEDGRGLVTRGKHRLFLRFPKNNVASGAKSIPKPVLYKMSVRDLNRSNKPASNGTRNPMYMIHDQLLNDLSQESRKYALRPVLTFDRLRVTTSQFTEMLFTNQTKSDDLAELSLLNSSLPSNLHLLTLQPWSSEVPNQILLRIENLDNPLLLHPSSGQEAYWAILRSYNGSSTHKDASSANECDDELRPRTNVDIEHLIRGIRIVAYEEMSLGANARLQDIKRLNFNTLPYEPDECERNESPTVMSLSPRQIRTVLATFEPL